MNVSAEFKCTQKMLQKSVLFKDSCLRLKFQRLQSYKGNGVQG